MGIARRVAGLTAGTAGLVGTALCVAGLVAVGLTYAEVMRRVDRLFGRADQALADVRQNLDQAAARLRETETELEAVRKREADLAAQPPAQRGARRDLSRRAVESVGPGTAEVRALLVKATEAGLIANGLLEALAELPMTDRVHVDADRLKEMSDRLGDLIEQSNRLAGVLARVGPAGEEDARSESSRAVEAVRQPIARIDSGSERVEGARQSITGAHARIGRWVIGLAVSLAGVLVWIAAGQISLSIHGWKLIRR